MSKYPECYQNIAQHMVDVIDGDEDDDDCREEYLVGLLLKWNDKYSQKTGVPGDSTSSLHVYVFFVCPGIFIHTSPISVHNH